MIYQSQTGCTGRDRARAIRTLGRKYDCHCSPEIMTAFIYAMNDADEKVRDTAIDALRRQARKNGCCCTQQIVCALTTALGDCHRRVRRSAEKALKECGYDVVDNPCCNQGCCDDGCCNNGCTAKAAPAVKAAPVATNVDEAPMPVEAKSASTNRLSNLLGLAS